jgi:hypothetical protein
MEGAEGTLEGLASLLSLILLRCELLRQFLLPSLQNFPDPLPEFDTISPLL